jgi:hypothetical protein
MIYFLASTYANGYLSIPYITQQYSFVHIDGKILLFVNCRQGIRYMWNGTRGKENVEKLKIGKIKGKREKKVKGDTLSLPR